MKTLLALLPLFSYAQGLTGIQSGFVFDTQSKVIRPVNGLPGVATLGEPVDVGVALNQVEFVRGSDVAYAAAEDRVYRIRLSTGTAETINETLAGGRLVAAGLFWIESSRTIQFLSDLSQVFVDSDGDLTAAVFKWQPHLQPHQREQ